MQRFFSEEHVWVSVKGGVATVGITSYAAEELGEITFVELPEVGSVFSQGDTLCVVESTKTASDVICPVGGTVCDVNLRLEQTAGLMNQAPERDAWICRIEEIEPEDLDSLMSEEQYEAYIEDESDE